MRNRIFLVVVILLAALLLMLGSPWVVTKAQEVADQVILKMKFIKDGVQTQASGVLQVGEVNTLSAAVATGTLTQVVAAPGSGSIYLRGLLVEKKSATPTITIQYGTGTNCGTGTTVLAGPITPVNEYIPLHVLVPAGEALCLQTDSTDTGVRALTN